MTDRIQEVQALRKELAALKAEVSACKNESAENADKIRKIEEELKSKGCGCKKVCD